MTGKTWGCFNSTIVITALDGEERKLGHNGNAAGSYRVWISSTLIFRTILVIF